MKMTFFLRDLPRAFNLSVNFIPNSVNFCLISRMPSYYCSVMVLISPKGNTFSIMINQINSNTGSSPCPRRQWRTHFTRLCCSSAKCDWWASDRKEKMEGKGREGAIPAATSQLVVSNGEMLITSEWTQHWPDQLLGFDCVDNSDECLC